MKHRTSIFFALAITSGVWAQSPTPVIDRAGRALADWQSRRGSTWTAKTDPLTGYAELVYGGRATYSGTASTEEQWIARAIQALNDTQALHGLDVSTLVPVRALHLPLGIVGSGDKWTVRFDQVVGGVPVVAGTANVLFGADGTLISVQSKGLPDLDGIAFEPVLTAQTAREQAVQGFEKRAGEPAGFVSEPRLVIAQVEAGERRYGRLAWEVDVQSDPATGTPVGWTYRIDALQGGALQREPNVHFFDISGNVAVRATPGTLPDTAGNAETLQGGKYVRLQNGSFNVVTDANGNFNIPGINTTQNVTVTLSNGPFANVNDQPSGTSYSLAVTLNPGSGNSIVLNPTSTDTITSQLNVFQHIASMRDYVRRVNPSDSHADFVHVGHANLAQTCNAYYDGGSINFFAAGGGCNNTAYSTVIAHEDGHWMNDIYGTGNGGDGMGEGNGDVFALYIFDTAINGQDFFTSGADIRTGLNNRQFCGDCNPACYGEVHNDGEPWMGAAWKVRVNLNTSFGNTVGDMIADQVFMGWMNAYDQSQIKSVIELQWLLLDDDDANLANGTPHGTEIMNGFRAQGFPGYFLELSGLTNVGDQTCEKGSYPVSVNVAQVQGGNVAAVTIQYTIDNGPTLSSSMTQGVGTLWTGAIPYVASPARVSYNVFATDDLGHTKNALCANRTFFIGSMTAFLTESFDGATDAGWTHGSVGDTSNSNDDWQRGTPAGRSGTSQGVPWTDPSSATSGASAWGNDLGGTGFNGAYQQNVHNFLRSPAFDCSGQTGVQLIFKRWLTVEESQFDYARILVNNVEVWRNPFSGNLLDTGWTQQAVDISAQADNNPSVTIQFELRSDAGLNLGGWQIDDLQLGRVLPAPACASLSLFCAGDGTLATGCPCGNSGAPGRGCANSANASGAVLGVSGTPNPDSIVLTASGMPNIASLSTIFLQGDVIAPSGIVFGDGVRCIDGTLIRIGSKTSPVGTAQYPEGADAAVSTRGSVVPGSGVSRGYQAYYRNSSAGFCPPATFNVSSAVRIIW